MADNIHHDRRRARPWISPSRRPTPTSPRERVKVSQDIAAALAHELRDPVYGITSAAQLLRYRITDDPVVEKNIGRIMREAERLNALVCDTARIRPPRAGSARAGESRRRVGRGPGRVTAARSRAKHSSPDTRPPSRAHVCDVDRRASSARRFSNALVNAIEAAPEGTDLAIAVLDAPTAAGSRPSETTDRPSRRKSSPQAFEPLVSTKAGHPGIGLAIAHRVICDHGGSIALDSAQGIGTTLTFSFPPAHG